MEDTIAILRGLESRYEVFHGVKITDNAIIAAATLSNRYITDRFLPDKAIDLIDEACAMIRTEMDSMPTELDVINRKIIQMEIEEAALKNEDDELSKGRLSELQKELAEQRDKFNTMKAQWENEKNAIGRVQQLREKIEQINREIETAQQNYDLEKAAKLMYGDLPEAVRRRPYSVILFDEIEKAHPDVFNILLQVLDDGRITDSQGRTVDFKNTIIILTSNLGSQYLLDGIGADGEITNEAKEQVQTLLHRTFRPEFLNRLDEIVFYKPLSKENITGIIDLQIAALNRRLADKQLRCELTQAAKQFIIDAAYDPQFGARPLRRYVQHTVETLLAKKILEGSVQPGSTITVDTENGELVLR